MINLFFVVCDFSGARTYADELLAYISEVEGIAIYKIFLNSIHHKEYMEARNGNLIELHFPNVKNRCPSIEKYSARCLDILQSHVEGKENIVFHLNAPGHYKFGVKAKERYGAKIIYTLHFLPGHFSYFGINGNSLNNSGSIIDSHEKTILFEADRIICVTKFAKEIVLNFYNIPREKVEAIHNGYGRLLVDVKPSGAQNTAIRKALGFDKNVQIILFVGELGKRKGINYLVRAFNKLSDKHRDLRLVIVGEGNFKETLQMAKGCWGKITFTGKVTSNELAKFYSIAKIGVIPSVYEQCSYVALEMMKHGLPVIVADTPGLGELYISGENSLKIPTYKSESEQMELILNENELSAALEMAINDKPLRQKLGRTARKIWERYYTANIMGEATYLLYNNMISNIECL